MSIPSKQLARLVSAVEMMTAATKVARQGEGSTPVRRMSPSEIAAILHIGRNEGVRLSDLAHHLRVAATTASSLVDRLVKAGSVSRARPEDDRRSLRLDLTEDGRVLRDQAEAEQEAWCRTMLEALDPAEREPFIRAMGKIADRLGQ